MNLVIDCFKLVHGQGKSVGIYNLTMNLVRRLGEENVRRGQKENIIVLGNDYNREDFEVPGVVFARQNGNPLSKLYDLYWELFGSAFAAKRYSAERVLFPRGFRPLVYKGKDTVLIHDLIPFYYNQHYPGFFNRLENGYIMARLKASIAGADRVITISDASLEDISRLVPGSAVRTARIHNGLNEMRFRPEPGRVRENSIVAVTSSLPHKNASGIAAFYSAYCTLCAGRGIEPLTLKLIGVSSMEAFIVEGLISRENAEKAVCLGFVKDYDDLCAQIAGARIFLFLSLAEGFGFPPLEAMQLGTPVVCSDRSSLPEVTGDAALKVDPDKPEEVAEAVLRLQQDEELVKELVRKGTANTERFSWESRVQLYWEELFRG